MSSKSLQRNVLAAVAVLLCACKGTPADADHIMKGVALSQRGQHAQAIEEFDRAIALEPGKPRAYYMRGIARFKLGAKDKALPDFQTACAMSDRDACTMATRAAAR